MTDIDLRLRGDSSGARAALDDTGDATKRLAEETAKAHEKWHLFSILMQEVVTQIVRFGVESVKAYAETQRVQAQLTRAAGEYSKALEEQAKALSRIYAVDDDVIMKGQILLAQWGGAGAATEEVTKATLNLAAAMGTDLNGATEMLIRNVESGGVSLAKWGIHFKETGDKGKDLAAAVEAINAKLGGAAAAEAGTLTGSLRGVSIAFEEVKRGIGENIAKFIEWSGVVGRVTEALRGMQTAMGIGDVSEQNSKNEAYLALQEHLNANLQQRAQLLKGVAELESRGESATKSLAMIAHLDENIAKLKEMIQLKNTAIGEGDSLPGVTDKTNKGMKEAAAAAAAERAEMEKLDAEASELYETLKKQTEEWNQNNAAVVGSMHGFEQYVSNTKLMADSIKNAQPLYDEVYKAWQKNNEKEISKRADVTAKFFAESNNDNVRAMHAQAEQWEKVGDQIGASFVGALQTQLSKLASGGEFDVTAFMGDILAATAGIAGTVIGTALGAPAVGSAIGNLAAMGIQAGFGSISRTKSVREAKKYHEGGWVEAELPRYHSGTWIGTDEQAAVLQTGERVASREEVANAGGKGALDATLKGRGGASVNITIHAIDAKSAADSFGSELGRGLRNSIRSGRGDLPSLLGLGVR